MCGRIYPDSNRHAVGADDNGIPYRPPHGMPFFLPYHTMMRPSLHPRYGSKDEFPIHRHLFSLTSRL